MNNSKHSRSPFPLSPHPPSPTSSHPPIFPQGGMGGGFLKCIINDQDLHLSQQLGDGCFGVVRKGEWRISSDRTVKVAVKSLRGDTSLDPEIHQEFFKEVNAMYALEHPHIIRLYGIVITPPMKMITELAPLGSLINHLHSFNGVYSLQLLWSYSIQIASGMGYLKTNNLIHRDLAARNVLVMSENMVKIGDFGLTRILEDNDDCYTVSANRKIPFAWCAPESLKFGNFSHSSDVWMFGVTMWEMFTYGQEPWLGLNGTQILSAIERQSARLECPNDCPSPLYNVMLKCWAYVPKERPDFSSLIGLLQEAKPLEVKVLQDGNNPFFMPLEAGDVVTVIDVGVENWTGQNQRNLRIGPFPADVVCSEDSKRVHMNLANNMEKLSLLDEDSHKQMRPRTKGDSRRPTQGRGKARLQKQMSKSMEALNDWQTNSDVRGMFPPKPRMHEMDSVVFPPRKMSVAVPQGEPFRHLGENPHSSEASWLLPEPNLHGRSSSFRRNDRVSFTPTSEQGPTLTIPQLKRHQRSASSRTQGDMPSKIRAVGEQMHGVNPERCQEALRLFGGDVTRAVQYLKVCQLYNVTRCSKEECRSILEMVDWSLEAASLHILYRGVQSEEVV